MDILPKTGYEFSQKEYWEDFFAKRKNAFEWYGEYADICELLHKYCKFSDNILMSGCGNSNLSEDMFDVGYSNIVNIDISDVVIKQMNAKKKASMSYLQMDIKNTTFDDDEFSVVIDKGTLDAIYSHENEATCTDMFEEILRILKVGGRYICITLAQEHILNSLLSFFPQSFCVRVHEVNITKTNADAGGLGSKLPVFVFVCTKMRSILASPVLEMYFSGIGKVNKFKETNELKKNIQMLQTMSIVRNKLEHTNLHEEIKVDLWSQDKSLNEPRYSLYVIDVKPSKLKKPSGPFAVFIIPNGRENNETFGSTAGRKKLAEAAGFSRLAIASLHRGHLYTSLDEVKAELSEKVMDLAPLNVDKDVQVPFLSTSADIGTRNIAYEGESCVYGCFVIEDVQSEEQYYYRQFVVLDNSDVVLARSRLMLESNKKKAKKRIPDQRYLLNAHEKAVLAGFSFGILPQAESKNVLVFGLHNTPLLVFMLSIFPNLTVTCVDVDSTLLQVYETWFGLTNCERFKFVMRNIDDFCTKCKDSNEPSFDVILIDHIPMNSVEQVELNENSSKSSRYGRTCGITNEHLRNLKRVLKTSGILMRLQKSINDTCELCMEDIMPLHFESKVGTVVVQFFINIDSNTSLEVVWEKAKQNSKQLVERFMSTKVGFYEKNEWSSVMEYVHNVAFFH